MTRQCFGFGRGSGATPASHPTGGRDGSATPVRRPLKASSFPRARDAEKRREGGLGAWDEFTPNQLGIADSSLLWFILPLERSRQSNVPDATCRRSAIVVLMIKTTSHETSSVVMTDKPHTLQKEWKVWSNIIPTTDELPRSTETPVSSSIDSRQD